MMIFFLGGLIILASIVGEIMSLWALFYETSNPTTGRVVLWSMIGLLGLMAIRPAAAIFKVTWVDWSETSSSDSKKE
jgi:hypothetical protein